MPLMTMENTKDPKQQVIESIGDISGVGVSANGVLIGIYQRPEKTASGIVLPESVRKEEVYQGKCGLILKMGPQAFKDSDNYKFADEDRRAVGDWVIIKVSDGWPVTLNNKNGNCRLVPDSDIRMTIDQPDKVF